jgi:HPt (histidine-containing phosphotransfer) domain-containing protein
MAASNPNPVDLAHLARYTGGERALDAEVLRLFANQSAELMAELQDVVAARDIKRWRHITHSLKGAARGIGAFALGDVAAEAEPLDPAVDTPKALMLLEALKERTETVNAFIAAYLQR